MWMMYVNKNRDAWWNEAPMLDVNGLINGLSPTVGMGLLE